MLRREALDHYARSRASDNALWTRLGGKPDVRGKVVLDIGCGWGGLCIDLAESGAKKVIGVDLTANRIEFCRENLITHYSHLESVIEFHCCALAELELEDDVDLVVSKDTFEHVQDLRQLLLDICRVLKHNGMLMSGFGPLYYSYYGDHKATGALLPWFHLLIPEHILINRINKKRGLSLTCIKDLGLNQLKLKEYLELFEQTPLELVFLKTNGSERLASKVFRLLAKIPFLTELFTQSIYIKMRKS